jgi:hypothetical protein
VSTPARQDRAGTRRPQVVKELLADVRRLDRQRQQAALDRVDDPGGNPARFTPGDQLLTFLEEL